MWPYDPAKRPFYEEYSRHYDASTYGLLPLQEAMENYLTLVQNAPPERVAAWHAQVFGKMAPPQAEMIRRALRDGAAERALDLPGAARADLGGQQIGALLLATARQHPDVLEELFSKGMAGPRSYPGYLAMAAVAAAAAKDMLVREANPRG